jgi:hypothetical protein
MLRLRLLAMRIILAMRNGAPVLPELPSDQADRSSLDAHLVERLAAAFREQGWEAIPLAGDRKADLVVARGKNRYVVELKAAREPRKPEMQGALANAILQSKAVARSIGGKPLAVLGAGNISDAMAESLREYVRDFGDGCPYGLIDLRGRLELHGPGLSGVGEDSESVLPVRPKSISPAADLFSDLGQWLLKVLLASRLPEKYLSAPRVDIRNAKHLAEVAHVSVPHVARQVAQLRSAGFLANEPGLRLVRVRELLDQWRAANRRLPLEVPARWLFPAGDPKKRLYEAIRKWSKPRIDPQLLPMAPVWSRQASRAALALFAACDAMGLSFVSGAPLHLYLEDASAHAFEELGLVAAAPGERIDVFVREPKYVESVFRAAIWRDGVAACDALQCWMDLADHPARGEEQAEQLWKRIIEPSLLRD